jgi:NhaA family Na+:H+ antiporter
VGTTGQIAADNDSMMARFLRLESAGGIVLMIAAVLAMVAANTGLTAYYDLLLSTPVEVRVGKLQIAKPLLLWINDGMMALFFFHVGLELKREALEGELSDPKNIILPAVGAVGGMVLPALCYLLLNQDDPIGRRGWAIPAATDIAFALGVLFLLGSRVPTSIKIFLTSLAIFDDIGAIIIIALFYTADLAPGTLIAAVVCFPVLIAMNRFQVTSKSAYLFVGIVMWVAVLKSGVHATLAGALLAMFIPLRLKSDESPLKELEHDLHTPVAFVVLPVFAFANAGLDLRGMTTEQLTHGVPVGIALGLFVGKQLGIFGACWLAIKLGWTKLPRGMSWSSLYGTAALCGIGFTMSLFIGSLAFEEGGVARMFDERLGIIAGSIVSGVFGYCILAKTLPKAAADAADPSQE